MDQTDNQFAYRCLPLNIANSHGWMILNPVAFTAAWDGGATTDSLSVQSWSADAPCLARSHFGSGILTFTVSALFRTEPGYNLMIIGPANSPKDAIQPLHGIVETDWAPFTFTMNWKFTRKGQPISFEREEPFCMIFPLKRGLIEEVEPEFRRLEEYPSIHQSYKMFAESRAQFHEDLRVPGSRAQLQGWQKDYFRGSSDFASAPKDHQTKLRLKNFKML
jgi:hypothetical protein